MIIIIDAELYWTASRLSLAVLICPRWVRTLGGYIRISSDFRIVASTASTLEEPLSKNTLKIESPFASIEAA